MNQHPPLPLRETRSLGSRTRQTFLSAAEVPIFRDLEILFVGTIEARSGFNWVRLEPEVSQIIATHEGYGEVLVDGKFRKLLPGEAYVTPKGVPHAYRAVSGTRWSLFWTNSAGNPGWFTGGCNGPEVKGVPAHQLYATTTAMVETSKVNSPAAIMNRWGELLHHSLIHAFRKSRSHVDTTELWARVRKDLAAPWSLARLAKAAGMGEEQLRRCCQRELHCSPMRYVTRQRIQYAAQLLAMEDLQVQAIAEKVGYSDPFTFSTAFRRITGSSPSQFRSALVGNTTMNDARVQSGGQ